MQFALIDNSAGAKTTNGSSLTPEVLQQIAASATVFLNRDVSAYWGLPVGALVRVSNGLDIQPGEWAFSLLPALPNAPGAIAYHDVNGQGVPVLFDGITLSDSLIGPGNSVSVAITHELAETMGDQACNLWADNGGGSEFALELCDAVESYDYEINGVYVSDFVLPAFFNPTHTGPFDQMGKVTTPFQTANGYQITRTSGTGETQVQGHARRLEKRRHPDSRTYRRGARV